MQPPPLHRGELLVSLPPIESIDTRPEVLQLQQDADQQDPDEGIVHPQDLQFGLKAPPRVPPWLDPTPKRALEEKRPLLEALFDTACRLVEPFQPDPGRCTQIEQSLLKGPALIEAALTS